MFIPEFIPGSVFQVDLVWISPRSKLEKMRVPGCAPNLVYGADQKVILVVKVHVPSFVSATLQAVWRQFLNYVTPIWMTFIVDIIYSILCIFLASN